VRPVASGSRPWAAAVWAAVLVALFVLTAAAAASGAQKTADIPGLLEKIRAEVLGLGRYAGEDFTRGEFFLGAGDDDTNKTHAVGILVQDGAEGSRMTIVVSRLDPDADNPRIKYARDPKTVVGRFAGGAVEVVRSDYPEAELAKLLPAVLKAVVDKRALLKRWALLLPPEPSRREDSSELFPFDDGDQRLEGPGIVALPQPEDGLLADARVGMGLG